MGVLPHTAPHTRAAQWILFIVVHSSPWCNESPSVSGMHVHFALAGSEFIYSAESDIARYSLFVLLGTHGLGPPLFEIWLSIHQSQ